MGARLADELDLSAAAEELRAVVAAVREAGPDSPPAPGPWCTYCPAYLRCPAQATLLRELLPVSAEQVPTLSAEQLPALYERLVLVESVVEAARKAVDTLARSNPIRLPDGRVYGLREEVHETLDPDVTERVLSELWGPEYAAKAVRAEKVATGAALEDAARARVEKLTAEAKAATLGGKARRVTVSSQEEAARAAIRAAGGARQRVVARLRAFRP
ncbi:MAG: DUF2800 domain-containing protein [Myxococcaceae bacterium]|nr:DUF2800 domain-containing protein [Myxococcaceae bacterium]